MKRRLCLCPSRAETVKNNIHTYDQSLPRIKISARGICNSKNTRDKNIRSKSFELQVGGSLMELAAVSDTEDEQRQGIRVAG